MTVTVDKIIEFVSCMKEETYEISYRFKDGCKALVFDFHGSGEGCIVCFESKKGLSCEDGMWSAYRSSDKDFIAAWGADEFNITKEEAMNTIIEEGDPRWDAFWDAVRFIESGI